MGESQTLNEFQEEIQSLEFPMGSDTIRAEYGEYELDLPNGVENVGEILDRGTTEDEYADAQAVLNIINNNVSSEAVGRKDYTDRGGIEGMNQRDSL